MITWCVTKQTVDDASHKQTLINMTFTFDFVFLSSVSVTSETSTDFYSVWFLGHTKKKKKHLIPSDGLRSKSSSVLRRDILTTVGFFFLIIIQQLLYHLYVDIPHAQIF